MTRRDAREAIGLLGGLGLAEVSDPSRYRITERALDADAVAARLLGRGTDASRTEQAVGVVLRLASTARHGGWATDDDLCTALRADATASWGARRVHPVFRALDTLREAGLVESRELVETGQGVHRLALRWCPPPPDRSVATR